STPSAGDSRSTTAQRPCASSAPATRSKAVWSYPASVCRLTTCTRACVHGGKSGDPPMHPPTRPERLAQVLSRLFTLPGWGAKQTRLKLEAAWRRAAGDAVFERTKLGAIRRGVLEVLVADTVLHQELAFAKRRLLDGLAQDLGSQVKELRFRIGS